MPIFTTTDNMIHVHRFRVNGKRAPDVPPFVTERTRARMPNKEFKHYKEVQKLRKAIKHTSRTLRELHKKLDEAEARLVRESREES